MASSEKPMTKTEIRNWIKRIRDDCRWVEEALKNNDADDLMQAVLDIGGAAGEIEGALGDDYYARGVRGLTTGKD